MKHILILTFLLSSITWANAQETVVYDDCEIKVRELVFTSINNAPKEVSVYRNENGEIYLREGHDSLNESSLVTYFKKNKAIRKCHEFYDILVDSTSPQKIQNYFTDDYSADNSDYLNTQIMFYSFLLQQFGEPLLQDSTSGLVVRMAYQRFDYINPKRNHQQRYNLVRYYTEADSLVFKSGFFDKEFRFIIDYSTSYKLKPKEVKRLSKVLQRINTDDLEPIYANNFTSQRLFEFSNGDTSKVFFRAEFYSEKVNDHMIINNLLYSCLTMLKLKNL